MSLPTSQACCLPQGLAPRPDGVGWLAFSMLVGNMQGRGLDLRSFAITIGLTTAFAAGLLTIGRGAIDRLLARMGSRAAASYHW